MNEEMRSGKTVREKALTKELNEWQEGEDMKSVVYDEMDHQKEK